MKYFYGEYEAGIKIVDAQRLFREITCIKTTEDIDSLRIAAKFTEFCFNELIN